MRKAVFTSRYTSLIHQMRTATVRLRAGSQRVLISCYTEFETDLVGLAPFIVGRIGRRVVLRSRMKTATVRLRAGSQRVLISCYTEFETDLVGLAPFIVGRIGRRVVLRSRMKRSRNSGA